MQKLCVFCGSGYGADPNYAIAAKGLAAVLVKENIGLVYGGAKVGIMGEIARAVHEAGGNVIGVIPRGLADREVAFEELTDLRIVNTMHERKALMAELSDGFIALPGGLGTLEEVIEIITWAQLGLHSKPCGLLNVNGYYDKLLQFLDHTVNQKFVEPEHREMIIIENDPMHLLNKFRTYKAPEADKARWALGMNG